ncbi:hypothetical protein CNEO3_260051 [Clostridium neonatale]|nr:hypothetical protein CNEO3_260051 [Clostridium neonatale]
MSILIFTNTNSNIKINIVFRNTILKIEGVGHIHDTGKSKLIKQNKCFK